jgi:DNA-binding Lrp family transcriptional regulator
MEHESLYTATKWDILKILERGPRSPLELANELKASLANVSQQIRLLELAGILTSERVPNRDKGQPRVLYRIAGDLAYAIATSDDFVDKKLLKLSEMNKLVLRIWFLDDSAVRRALEKAVWAIEGKLARVHTLTYAGTEKGVPTLEYSGDAALPAKIALDGITVAIRKAAKPKGHALLERRG